MRYCKHNVVVAGRKKLGGKVFHPLFLFQAATVRTVPVTTAMILLMQVVTVRVGTPVMMHAQRCCMALIQLLKNMLTVTVVMLYGSMVKNLLKLTCLYNCTHDLVCITASKGDWMAARLVCCRCR
jgi:hypothetical protein